MNPVDHPEQYDSFLLADQRSPGICKLSGPMLDHGWQKQKAKGSGGGETIHNGDDLVEFNVELYLWRDDKVDHFAAWDAWRPLLRRPVAKGASKALDIYHPQLAELDVTSVVCTKEGTKEPDRKGGAVVKLSFLQYAPSKSNAAGKPAGSASAGQGGTPGAPGAPNVPKAKDPNQDLKDQVAELTDQFSEPGAGA